MYVRSISGIISLTYLAALTYLRPSTVVPGLAAPRRDVQRPVRSSPNLRLVTTVPLVKIYRRVSVSSSTSWESVPSAGCPVTRGRRQPNNPTSCGEGISNIGRGGPGRSSADCVTLGMLTLFSADSVAIWTSKARPNVQPSNDVSSRVRGRTVLPWRLSTDRQFVLQLDAPSLPDACDEKVVKSLIGLAD